MVCGIDGGRKLPAVEIHPPSLAISRFTYWGTLLGVVLLIVCILGGLFGTEWYFLYPLPLMSQHVWQPWATLVFFIALAILGVCWTIWTLDILRSIAQRYSLGAGTALPQESLLLSLLNGSGGCSDYVGKPTSRFFLPSAPFHCHNGPTLT